MATRRVGKQGWKSVGTVRSLVEKYGWGEKFRLGMEEVRDAKELEHTFLGKTRPGTGFDFEGVEVFVFSDKVKNLGGQAILRRGEVAIGLHPVLLFSEGMRRELESTFFHELAHVVAWVVYDEPRHGYRWKWMMKRFREEANVYHNFASEAVAFQRGRKKRREEEVAGKVLGLFPELGDEG